MLSSERNLYLHPPMAMNDFEQRVKEQYDSAPVSIADSHTFNSQHDLIIKSKLNTKNYQDQNEQFEINNENPYQKEENESLSQNDYITLVNKPSNFQNTISNTLVWREDILTPQVYNKEFKPVQKNDDKKQSRSKGRTNKPEYLVKPRHRKAPVVHSEPNLLLHVQKKMDGKIFTVKIRDYKNSLILELVQSYLGITAQKSISIKTFLKHTGGVSHREYDRAQQDLLSKDEIIFKMRLEILAEKLALDQKNNLKICETVYPHEDCLIRLFKQSKLKSKKKNSSSKKTKKRKKSKKGKSHPQKLSKHLRKQYEEGQEIFDFYDKSSDNILFEDNKDSVQIDKNKEKKLELDRPVEKEPLEKRDNFNNLDEDDLFEEDPEIDEDEYDEFSEQTPVEKNDSIVNLDFSSQRTPSKESESEKVQSEENLSANKGKVNIEPIQNSTKNEFSDFGQDYEDQEFNSGEGNSWESPKEIKEKGSHQIDEEDKEGDIQNEFEYGGFDDDSDEF